MGQYKSQYTGPQIDAGINAALNPDVAVTPDSDALVTSGAVADALDNIDQTITSDTDTTLNGILVGNGSKVGTKSLDTSSLTNDAYHVPASSVVKSALDAKADKNDLATIHQTSPTCTETNGIAAGVFFYLDNELVVAKTAIANGATFTLNTNYESPTAGGLNALKSALGDIEDITITFTNVHSNGQDYLAYKQNGMVYVSFSYILFTQAVTANTWFSFGTLPSGCRPEKDTAYVGLIVYASGNPATLARVIFGADGSIKFKTNTGFPMDGGYSCAISGCTAAYKAT